jgi:poly-gamma-glutamate capsule biosynthesis protein CapA/YwtB (metallophosphatase superfamily)
MKRSVRLVSGGDVMFWDPLAEIPAVATAPVQAALDYLKAADFCYMNCEMSLTAGGMRIEKTVNLRSSPDRAAELATLGIDAVTLANNHMLDWGHAGLFDTMAALDAAGIPHVGAGATVSEALRPHVAEVNGVRFAFIGVAATLPPGFAAGDDRPGIAPIHVSFSFEVDPNLMSEQPGTAPWVHTIVRPQDVERVTDLISVARREVDHVIVAVHWGLTRRRVTPYQGMIAEYQGPLGRAFIDAGADLVVGNHSHNLHGVEVYRGKPIFYSLGNFIFTHIQDYMEPESLIVVADFAPDGLRVELVPLLVHEDGFPRIVSGSDRQQVLDLLQERSAQFGTRFVPTAEGVAIDLG